MGVPRFAPEQVPMAAPQAADRYALTLPSGLVEFSALSMGNPHAVLVVAAVDDAPVATLGPQLETHGDFPRGTNVEFMQVVDRGQIRLRVHERGVGETPACGSGACAAVVAGVQQGLLGDDVDVILPGGRLRIQWAGPGFPVWMTGEALHVFEGRLPL
jgi:diaminopimelate epimerase